MKDYTVKSAIVHWMVRKAALVVLASFNTNSIYAMLKDLPEEARANLEGALYAIEQENSANNMEEHF